MITEAFILTGFKIADFLISLFPLSDGFPPGVLNAFSSIQSYLWWLNSFVPINTFLSILVIVISVELLIGTSKLIRWIVSYLPLFKGGGKI